jgi:hypothetical protein
MKFVLGAFLTFVAVLISGCGGGGGGVAAGDTATAGGSAAAQNTIITGTAAAGAPIIGTISVSDSSTNAQPVKTGIPIAADGKYSVDVAGLKPPFAFLADGTVGGKRVQLYSAAVEADMGGTINITPFTDLVVRNIAGTIATTLADAISAKLPNLTVAQLDEKCTELTAQLTPVLQAAGLSTSIDLMRSAFNADGTGLDRFMDLVKVDTTVPTAVKITNILDADHPLTVNTEAGGVASGGTTLSASGVDKTSNPVDDILQTFKTMSSLFATSLPSSSDPALLALFSTTFKDDGDSRDKFLTNITTDKKLIGLQFGNSVEVESIDTTGGVAKLHFVPVNGAGMSLAGGDNPGGVIRWQMTKSGTTWLFDGNQKIARARVRTVAEKTVCSVTNNNGCTSGTTYITGLNLDIDDRAQIGIKSAVVTGPGLPAAGVTLTSQPNQTWLTLPVNCTACTNNNYRMTDADIAKIAAHSTYTIVLYGTSATPLATYADLIPVPPVFNGALAAMAFPSISNVGNLAGYTGGTLTPTWTIPAGLLGDFLEINVFQLGASGPGQNQFVEDDLNTKTGSSGTSTLVIDAPLGGGTWSGGNYSIGAWDQYGGQIHTNYQ